MRKAAVLIIVLMCLSLSGCKNLFPKGTEMERYDAATVMGIDRCETDRSNVEVTLLTKVEKSGGDGGSVTIKLITETGPTVFEAQRKLRAKEEKITFLGYVDYVLIGEAAAKDDFTKYFDYFVRDHETRLTPRVFIVKDCSVKEFMDETSSTKIFLTDQLANIIDGANLLGNTSDLRVIEAMNRLNDKYGATVIPALKCKEIENQKRSGEMAKKDVAPDGFAVIKDFKLEGYIDKSAVLGCNFLTDKVKSCPISIQDKTGAYVALEVIGVKTKTVEKFEGDELKEVTYKVTVLSTLPEQQSRENLFTDEGLRDLAAKQSAYVEAVMKDAISVSKELGTDCFGLAGKVYIQHPYKWEKLKDSWNEIYPKLTINVEVESAVERTYDINKPVGYREEGA